LGVEKTAHIDECWNGLFQEKKQQKKWNNKFKRTRLPAHQTTMSMKQGSAAGFNSSAP
jgi:hypothetical protein